MSIQLPVPSYAKAKHADTVIFTSEHLQILPQGLKKKNTQEGKQFKEKIEVPGSLCAISDLSVVLETR